MSTPSRTDSMSNSDSPTILVVDDDPTTLGLISDYLAEFGFRVRAASDGKSALKEAQSGQPDLILLDVLMPKMDGFETCRRLKAKEALKDIPVIFMTSLTETADKIKGFQAGGADYITKPFAYEEFLSRIRVHLVSSANRRQLEVQNVQLQEEIARRKLAEEALREAHAALEQRVKERTAELAQANATLMAEITERKRAEESWRENEQMLKSILSTSPVGISLTVDRQIKWANEAWLNIFGFKDATECVGQSTRILYPSQEEFDRAGKALYPKLETGTITETDVKFKRQDGVVFDAHIRIRALDPSDLAKGVIAAITDITERKLAEEALRKNEAKYRLLVDNAPIGIILVDKEGRILDVNPKLLKILGSPSAEATKSINMLTFPPLVEAGLSEAFERCQREGMPLESEHRYTSKWGKPTCLRIGLRPLSDSAGIVYGCLAVAEDISDRKRAEEALRVETGRFQMLAENAPFGLVMVGKDGAFKYINPKFKEILGYDLSDVPNGRVWFRKAYPDPQYRNKVIATWLADPGGESSGGQRGGVFKVTCKDGTQKTIDFKQVGVSSGENVLSLQDITARTEAEKALRASEERFRTLFEESRDAVYMTTREGALIAMNQAFLDLFGFTKDEAENIDILRIHSHPADRKLFLDEMERTGSLKDHEVKLWKKDGTEIDCLLSGTLRLDKGGTILGYQGIIRDVTDRKKLEKQLLQAQKMEAIGTLAGGIAHDFNNLLTIVMGFSELMLSDKSEQDPDYEDLRKIHQASQHGADLVRRILTFSRHAESKPRPVKLNREIVEARKLLESTVPKMVQIKILLADDLKPVNADPGQIEQVLMNLAVNAWDAMPEGGILTIQTENVHLDQEYCSVHLGARPGDYAVLSISDTGQGMDKETLDRIFEPFFTTKEVGKGTGLGLAMVYGIVKQHDGHMTCYSELGVGTTFNVYLPVVEMDEERQEATDKEILGSGSETILLVDDEESVRILGERMLTGRGYTVLTAGNGIDALEVYKQRRGKISLVILDLVMPGMGGKQCLEELLRIDPRVKVLIASGQALNARLPGTIESGARAFVSKPFKIRELLKKVRAVLDAD